jgi:hypothetical protein
MASYKQFFKDNFYYDFIKLIELVAEKQKQLETTNQ